MKQHNPMRAGIVLMAGTILQRLANLGLIALLTATLTPDDFTRYGLFMSVIVILPTLAAGGLQFAAARLTFDYKEHAARQAFLRTNLMGSTIIGGGVLLLLALTALFAPLPPLHLLKSNPLYVAAVFICCVSFIAIEFCRVFMRTEGAVFSYVGVTLTQHAGVLAFTFFCLKFITLDFHTLLLCFMASYGAAAAAGLAYSLPRLGRGPWSKKALKSSAKYSLPLAFHALSGWGIAHSGRWIGSAYLGLEAMAPYLLIVQAVSIMQMLNGTILDARLPEVGERIVHHDFKGAKRIITRTLIFCGVIITAAYGFAALALYVWHLPLPRHYSMPPPLLIGAFVVSLLEVIYIRGTQIISLVKRTELQLAASTFSGLITLGTSLSFVHLWPTPSALIAGYAIGAFAQALMTNLIANRFEAFQSHPT